MTPYIISLTTIPPRFDKIGPTLRDLTNQKAKPLEIRLNLSRQYRRFPGELPSLPDLPEGVTVHWSDVDYGPATKILPTVTDWQGKDIDILFCDDDEIYEPEWSSYFLNQRTEHPDKCIVAKGYNLTDRKVGHRYNREYATFPRAQRPQKGLWYRTRRAATLGMHKPSYYQADGIVDILEAYRGVLVKPDFFPEETFDIPDILWTVDDPWLSGHLERNGIPIWLLSKMKMYKQNYEAHYSDALHNLVYRDHDRLKADTACIDYFRDTYGIWRGWKETPETALKKNIRHFFGKPLGFAGPDGL